jgi:hypothetical protein
MPDSTLRISQKCTAEEAAAIAAAIRAFREDADGELGGL